MDTDSVGCTTLVTLFPKGPLPSTKWSYTTPRRVPLITYSWCPRRLRFPSRYLLSPHNFCDTKSTSYVPDPTLTGPWPDLSTGPTCHFSWRTISPLKPKEEGVTVIPSLFPKLGPCPPSPNVKSLSWLETRLRVSRPCWGHQLLIWITIRTWKFRVLKTTTRTSPISTCNEFIFVQSLLTILRGVYRIWSSPTKNREHR